ncbi:MULTISPECIES: hypothetical protein [Ruminococcus]|uniref:Uncharacterized protein n=1 Tax=Ruminococcus flavefaciens TaxID=1265 RepID=A0A1M7J7D7_RUMFL|nr:MULTISPECIES: hypothetical protein [Ruminococcus]MCR4793844.1 hypothetical protein [Ruminococcus sp.]SHM48936.1 hypothetical protein SAMN04487860_105179 [Ruminococcus flavefaciens]
MKKILGITAGILGIIIGIAIIVCAVADVTIPKPVFILLAVTAITNAALITVNYIKKK